MSPRASLGLSDETIASLKSLIQTHIQCRHRCNRCLDRVKDPIARAELRRLSALHYRQAGELQSIVWSSERGADRAESIVDALQLTRNRVLKSLTTQAVDLADVASKERAAQARYDEAIGRNDQQVRTLLKQQKMNLGEVANRLVAADSPGPI